jgi:hypothetical protein
MLVTVAVQEAAGVVDARALGIVSAATAKTPIVKVDSALSPMFARLAHGKVRGAGAGEDLPATRHGRVILDGRAPRGQ